MVYLCTSVPTSVCLIFWLRYLCNVILEWSNQSIHSYRNSVHSEWFFKVLLVLLLGVVNTQIFNRFLMLKLLYLGRYFWYDLLQLFSTALKKIIVNCQHFVPNHQLFHSYFHWINNHVENYFTASVNLLLFIFQAFLISVFMEGKNEPMTFPTCWKNGDQFYDSEKLAS